MDARTPEVRQAFWAFDKAAVADGAIPVRYKELIAVAVALTTRCPDCSAIHSGNARKAGATDAELTEATDGRPLLVDWGDRPPTHRTRYLLKRDHSLRELASSAP